MRAKTLGIVLVLGVVLCSSFAFAGWFDWLFGSDDDENLVGDARRRSRSYTETVTCVFDGLLVPSVTQDGYEPRTAMCYSPEGSCTTAEGEYYCSVRVRGRGELWWASRPCYGNASTTIDGNDEKIVFYCGSEPPSPPPEPEPEYCRSATWSCSEGLKLTGRYGSYKSVSDWMVIARQTCQAACGSSTCYVNAFAPSECITEANETLITDPVPAPRRVY